VLTVESLQYRSDK
jgi:ATP-dependent Lon protease